MYWSTNRNRIWEVLIIVIMGAVISILNTLWLKRTLINQIEKIAQKSESNIVSGKVVSINDKTKI